MADKSDLYQSKPAIVNKFLNEDGTNSTLDEIIAQAVPGATTPTDVGTVSDIYKSKSAIINKFLNEDGTTSTLDEILARTIGGITQFDVEVVEELPETGEKGILYLVPNEGSGGNSYDEYVWITSTSSFEKIGTTDIDLSGYVQKSGDTMTGGLTMTNATIGSRKANTTVGTNSLAVGTNVTASGDYSHAEGNDTSASGGSAHAEGGNTIAFGQYSHAEGYSTRTNASAAHAEGNGCEAQGTNSHAEGTSTKALSNSQHVQGKYNVPDNQSIYQHIIGNGTSNAARSNAHTVDWSGNAWFSGDVYVGSTSGTNKDAGSKKLATEHYVDTQISTYITQAIGGSY